MSQGEGGGRPSIFTQELADRICATIAITPEFSIKTMCDTIDWFPSHQCINEWRMKNTKFGDQYAQAKMLQAEFLAENLQNLSKDKLKYTDAEGNERVDAGSIASQRLQADTVKWLASKLAPKIYGDRASIHVKTTISHEDALKDLT